MTQGARNRTLTKLRQGDVKVLVATDVAARGIDVQGISHVINYDLPKFAEDYVHRIGRTGRAGATGIAISFASNMDRHILRKIEQFTGNRMEAAVVEGFEPKRAFNTSSGKDAPRGNRGAPSRGGRNERAAHTPGGRGGYQPRDNNRASFGDRIMGEKPAGRNSTNNASDGRMGSEKSYAPRSGGFNDRNKERTHDGARPARSFGDRNDRPVRNDAPNRERFANNEFAGNRENQQREVNGNSRSYTKDTDMQFARELSKGFGGRNNSDRASNDRGSAPKPYARKPEGNFGARPGRSEGARSAPRSDAPRANTGEKFGNPRPRPISDRPARAGGDSAPRRPRSFA
jgi:superfamily II DNA/RNA helicase